MPAEREVVLCGLPLARSRRPLDRQTSTLHVLLTEVSEKWTSKVLESLDTCLNDKFATSYLMRFSSMEFNSENIAFLLAARRYFAQPGVLPSAELRSCLASVCLPADLKVRAKAWLKSDTEESGDDIIREAFKIAFKTVSHDTFFRFKESDFCAELRGLHLSNMLQRPHFREYLSSELTNEEREAVQLWQAIHEFVTQHKSLASGWAADSTVKMAKGIMLAHQTLLKKIGITDESIQVLTKQLPESPIDMFDDAQLAALNFLFVPYERLLDDSATCEAWLQTAGLSRASAASAPTPCSIPNLEDGLSDEDYAAGW